MSAKIVLQCLQCRSEFSQWPCNMTNGRGKFCSRACHRAAQISLSLDPVDIARRFWRRVDKEGPVPAHCPELGPCAVWRPPSGRTAAYPTMTIGKRSRVATSVAWFLEYGVWPNFWMLHRCDGGEIGCVRVSHLFDGTAADNSADMVAKGRAGGGGPRGERAGAAVLTVAEVIEIRALYEAGGITYYQLAERFGVARPTIQSILSGRTWSHLLTETPIIVARDKLTPDDVREIRRELAAGTLGKVIAARFGVVPGRISSIKHGLTWKHVPL